MTFIVGYSPTDIKAIGKNNTFWRALDKVVKEVPEHKQLFVLMDPNARTGRKGGGRLGNDFGVRDIKFSAPTVDTLSTIMVSDSFHFLPMMGLHG